MNFSSLFPIIFIISSLLSIAGVLLRVAFFTLIERKVIGLIHFRKGPNKIILRGVSQPISDAVKLLRKESPKINFVKTFIFISGPFIAILIILLLWSTYESFFQRLSKSRIVILLIICIIRLTPYTFFLMGWGSNTKYALIGSLRAIAQVISYEVCIVLFLLSVIYICGSYKVSFLINTQSTILICVANLPLFMCWLILCMAERNRTPFDHAERERELVSGFNVEYGGGVFAVIFIREYGIIIFLRFLTSVIFLGGFLTIIKTIIICSVFIWVRCRFPRVRYDKLIIFSWKICLPYRLALLAVYV